MAGPITSLMNSFVNGLLSPFFEGRTDLNQYFSSLRKARNWIFRAQGAAYRRPGLRFVAEIKDSSSAAVLVPFNYNDTEGQSYVLELGDETMRFFWEGAQILDGASPYELATPWTASQVEDVRYLQLGDIMYMVHPDVPPQKLTRNGHTDWTMEAVEFIDGPWKDRASGDDSIVITPSARIGTGITLTASDDLFDADHVGALIRLGYTDPSDPETTQWGYAVITAVASATSATATVKFEFGAQHFTDPNFDVGIADWEDASTDTSCEIDFDAANSAMSLTQGTSGYAMGSAEIAVTTGVKLTLILDVLAVPHQCRVYVGSSKGGTGYLDAQTITTTGEHTFDILPTVDTIYVTVDTSGATAADVVKLDTVGLIRKDISTSEWRMGAFSDVEGYPEQLIFHEQRLILGKGRYLHASKTGGLYETFTWETPIVDDDAFSVEITAERTSQIVGMVSSEDLLVMTNAAVVRVVAGTDGSYLSASDPIKARPQCRNGAKSIAPVSTGASVLMVSTTGKVVQQLNFNYDIYRYQAQDITAFAEQITGVDGVRAMAFADEPVPILWACLEDGGLIGCTYMPAQQVVSWHPHQLGGDGAVESLCVIPGDGFSELWCVVRRTIDGSTVRYIERMSARFDGTAKDENGAVYPDARNAFLVDCGLTLNAWEDATGTMTLAPDTADTWDAEDTGTMASSTGVFVAGDVGKVYILAGWDESGRTPVRKETRVEVTGYTSAAEVDVKFLQPVPESLQSVATSTWAKTATVISGLDHLEGEAVAVLADGNSVGEFTVSSGAITLTNPAAIVHAGFGYDSLLQPMRLEIPVNGQTIQAKNKRITKATLRVIDTVGGEVCAGDDVEADYVPLGIYGATVAGGTAPPLATGDKDVELSGASDKKGLITVRQTEPLPMTVVCLIPVITDIG